MAMDELGMARDVLGMEERRVERAEACRRLHEVKLDGGSHEMLSAIARAVLPDATMGWTVGACERLRAHLVWLLGAGMPEIGALGEDVDKHTTMDGCGPQIGSQGFEENRMSITDELRKYAQSYKNSHDAWSGIGNDLDHIADRIDTEYKKALSGAYADKMDANGWVRLPLDADGEPIRIGDVMESKGSDFLFGEASFEVRAMRYDEGGWEVYDRLGDRYAPSLLRHHHKPTVEDVLREFAAGICGQNADFAELAIAEYAKRLRLREDA